MSNKRDSATLIELQQHIVDLCKAFDVELVIEPTATNAHAELKRFVQMMVASGGRQYVNADKEERRLVMMPISNEMYYAVALHELGHFCHPGGRLPNSRDANGVINVKVAIEEEENAWTWAIHHALIWTMGCQDALDKGMKSYLKQVAA